MGNNELHGGHRERLRQRLIAEGIDSFEPHELLELLLYYAIPRQNVNLLAHELLDNFGNLRNVLSADVQELTAIKGMGESTAHWLNLIGRCSDLCAQMNTNGFLDMSRASMVIQSIRQIRPQPAAPCLIQLCLNRKNALLYRRILSSSRKWGEAEILREGIRDVFSTDAKHVILVLIVNESSVAPTPYDLQKTQDYAYALNTADSVLLDFILLDSDRHYSLRGHGQIPNLDQSIGTQRICEDYLSVLPVENEENARYNDYFQGDKT